MTKYAMVIDQQKCTGCAGCSIACKGENNIADGIFWSHYKQQTTGTFPNVKLEYISTLCNHCTDAPCVEVCPTTPKSMYKADNGMTKYNSDTCISCRMCERSCPYEQISFNAEAPTFDGKYETAKPLYTNPDRDLTAEGGTKGIRKQGHVEKCTFCDHRVANGQVPRCVETCPADARVFGDLDDPNSQVSRLINNNEYFVLQPETGAKPNVYYIKSYSPKA
ncbi:4Fe-4S dicluster domain-containing protein [Desulfuribacillus alkaliarsenatis]|uniref:4Fe-4S ferredoxin n=1 Tax=Desulfuribacillus alkaliarsenatis TaxID=766136 RepID=A0A1E5G0P1_9FIRM|nr:4Fe-4S dicluster domain-containing protein [Desulfuribacillus alkaliarsenatis]OEF96487.1 4Fe-4S ferredoxin [Desulfuribacillus alkaliarsenatis]